MRGCRIPSVAALGLGLALAAGCAPSPPEPPPPPPSVPAPAPAPTPPETPAVGWRDQPLSPGAWIYRADERGSLALYGPANGEASFMVRCEMPQRRIVFSRAGSLPAREGVMSFTTTAASRGFPAQDSGGAQPYVAASTSARDGWLDELAFTRGRFSVGVPGRPLLVLPNWPPMVRVFEDCRA